MVAASAVPVVLVASPLASNATAAVATVTSRPSALPPVVKTLAAVVPKCATTASNPVTVLPSAREFPNRRRQKVSGKVV